MCGKLEHGQKKKGHTPDIVSYGAKELDEKLQMFSPR